MNQTTASPPAPRRTARHFALDYFRGAVVLLIVACHSVRAYQQFGYVDRERYWLSSGPVVDARRWLGFDAFLSFADLWVVPMLFFVSALFVWPGLERRGAAAFLRERWRRLGVPFVVVVASLMPIAYYFPFRAAGGDPGFAAYLRQSALRGFWPSGPAWFNWVLLAFGAGAALAYTSLERARRESRWVERGRDPKWLFTVLPAAAALAYLPALAAFGPARWFALGPFAGQPSRLAWYGAYFCAGVWAGAAGSERGVLAEGGWLVRRWRAWALVAAVFYGAVVLMHLDRLNHWIDWPRGGWAAAYAVLSVPASAALGFAGLAACLRFSRRRVAILDSFCRNAYGIFLIHFVFVMGFQYALLDADLGASLKAATVFVPALALSWLAAAALRRIPAVERVL